MFALEVPVVFVLAMILALAAPAPAVTPDFAPRSSLGRWTPFEVPTLGASTPPSRLPSLARRLPRTDPAALLDGPDRVLDPAPLSLTPPAQDSRILPPILAAAPEAPPAFALLPPSAPAEPLAAWPRNLELVNPFGREVDLACEGLMQWLAPRQRGRRWHSGLDLVPARGKALGRKLYSPGDGFVITRADNHPSWGSYLVIGFRKADRLYLTTWFHLKWGSHRHLQARDLARGISGQVLQGDYLGRVGSTGAARGAHLHLDVLEVNPAAPEAMPRNPWRGREWSQVRNPAEVITGLPEATWEGRQRPSTGLLVRAVRLERQT